MRDATPKDTKELIEKRGPSSESCSILGRIYKDQWEEASKRKDISVAKNRLEKALEAYLQGFEADWQDAYPGINTVTLMELRNHRMRASKGWSRMLVRG